MYSLNSRKLHAICISSSVRILGREDRSCVKTAFLNPSFVLFTVPFPSTFWKFTKLSLKFINRSRAKCNHSVTKHETEHRSKTKIWKHPNKLSSICAKKVHLSPLTCIVATQASRRRRFFPKRRWTSLHPLPEFQQRESLRHSFFHQRLKTQCQGFKATPIQKNSTN